jgi:hypothetical protein
MHSKSVLLLQLCRSVSLALPDVDSNNSFPHPPGHPNCRIAYRDRSREKRIRMLSDQIKDPMFSVVKRVISHH